MRQVLGPGALGRPRGIGWRGRWEGGLGWGIKKKKKKKQEQKNKAGNAKPKVVSSASSIGAEGKAFLKKTGK